MATVNLGRIKPVFRGAYNSSTAYVVDDIVTDSNETFICILASTGNATSNATYWTKLAAKGTDGTDVGTTLTTQGDILYRDGSGLQRLAAGTSGQVLQTGGTGANPSWTNVSSDFVKVYSTTTDSSASSYHDYVHFSDTYQHYRVIYTDDGTASGTSHFIRVGNGSIDTATNYRWQAHYTSNASGNNHGSVSGGEMRLGWSGDGSGYNNMSIVDFINARDSSIATTVFGYRFCKDHGSNYLNVTMSGRHEVNGVIDRFRIYNDSGNITLKQITIYGMKA